MCVCVCVCVCVCLFSPAPLSLFSSLQGSILAKSASSPFLSATSLCSLSPSAFNPWLETAGAALSGGRVQSEEPNLIQKGEAGEIAGNVYFAIGRKTVFFFSLSLSLFFSPITYEYLHINDSPVAVKEERELGKERQTTNEDEVSWE